MSSNQSKFAKFVKNNVALLLIAFCAIAIFVVVLAVSLQPDAPIDNPVVNNPIDKPSGGDITPEPTPVIKTEIVKVYYSCPLVYEMEGMGYTNGDDVLFVYNSTLNVWKTHEGVDLIADEGTIVCAMYSGTVIDVTETYGMGNSVTIDHGNGVIATYASLSNVQVVNGQVVEKGEQIASVSTSASYEFVDGNHLHLEVKKDGVYVDPMPYVNGEIYTEKEVVVTID